MAGLNGFVPSAKEQFLLLLRVHFKVLLRQATATPGRKLVSTLLVGLGTVASVLLGFTAFWAMWVGRHRTGMSPASLDEAMHLSLVAVWAILVLSPALGFRGNEFLDVSRLFHLPVSHRTVFTASTVGIALSGAVLFWIPPLFGLVLGHMAPSRGPWSNRVDFAEVDWGLFAVRLGLVAFLLFQAVALGQVLVLLLLDFLRSRRFREIGFVAAPVLAGTIYLGTWWALTRGRARMGPGGSVLRDLLGAGLSDRVPFLPPRWLSETLVGAGPGDAAAWLPFLLGFVPATLLAVAAAALLQERAFLGEVPPETGERAGAGRRFPGGRLFARFFPDPALAVASKELRLLGREPIVRTVLIGQAFFLALPILVVAMGRRGGDDPLGTVARTSWLLPFVLVFVENTLTMNLLGLEGPGVAHLRTTPVPWRTVLVGKDLCYLLVFGTLNALFSTAALLALAAVRPERVPHPLPAAALAALEGTCALAVVLAVGNVLSVALPSPLTVRGRMALRQQGSFSEGCYEKLARVAVFAGTLVLVLPIPMLLHVLPNFAHGPFQEPWWPPVGAVLGALYAGALLRASLPLAERTARDAEEAILRRLTRSGE